jgi:peroxiredoxin
MTNMIQRHDYPRRAKAKFRLADPCLGFLAAALLLSGAQPLHPQVQKTVWSDQERPIVAKLQTLRGLPDDERARTTRQLALDIRQLPATDHKVRLANGLANLSTEGDFGHDTLQEVATTLAEALREHPLPADHAQPAMAYVELAQLLRYEHVQVALDSPQFEAAMSKLAADDQRRQRADFTLTDLDGTLWTLKDLRGRVVLVNFWATWCPPCRKEMPDLQMLYTRFKDQGLVILAISDEDADKVKPFLAGRNVTYPILLDPGRKVNELFQVEGIPKSFVYDRNGRLAAEAIDMRTERQFLEMLTHAGLP